MDVVLPELVWLDGRCYRINDTTELDKRDDFTNSNESKPRLCENDDYDEDEEIHNLEFIPCNNGRIKAIISIATFYFRFIIGAKGSIVKRLMSETKTEIKMPHGDKRDITIIGFEERNIASAVRRINMIVMAARKKQKPTHFLSIPVATDEILLNLKRFKDEILKDPPQGVNESIFIEPAKLHVTLIVMCLVDNEERTFAANLLQDAKKNIIEPVLDKGPIEVEVVGVSYMNDDPRQTHVLYGEIIGIGDHKDTLHSISEDFRDLYSRNGFETQRQTIKLHVTLMKSKEIENESDVPSFRNKRIPFDSTSILENYSKFFFGRVTLKEIHLSQMHTQTDNEYYRSTSMIFISS